MRDKVLSVYLDDNERALSWIGDTDWVYETTVTVHVSDSGPGDNGTDTTGLGLALTHRLIRAQNGRLITELNQPGPSARIVLLRASDRSQSDTA